MSVTMEDAAKWQPSVLHLLPFSRNNAGTVSSKVNGSANQHVSYAREASKGEFPALGAREKPRSKSAAVVDENKRYSQTQQQHRLLRATSERLSRSQRRIVERNYIQRAQSEYSTKADRKLTQEVVTFAIKDINEQILGLNCQQEDPSSDCEDTAKLENTQSKVKPLLKPLLRLKEGRWPQTNPRFWRSSTISPGERELQKHKTSLDIQLSALKRSKRVKLNVKDLPRSQTPVGENDPDKLNMKQVIAFLQSSGETTTGVREDDGCNENDKIKGKNNQKSEKLPETGQVNGRKDSSAALVIAARSRRRGDNSTEHSRGLVKSDTFLTQESTFDDKTTPGQNDCYQSAGKQEDDSVTIRPNSYSQDPSSTNPLMEHHNYLSIRKDSHNRTQRPKSLQFTKENTEFRIPARIRQIRESTADNRPFRLHRFLTLVSNTPQDRGGPSKMANTRSNGMDSRFTSPTLQSRSHTRASSKFSKTRGDENRDMTSSEQNGSYTDAKGYFMRRNSSGKNVQENRKSEDKKARNSRSFSPTKSGQNATNGNEKIICLPTMAVDADSDDDFISLPTVPSKATRKDLSLSANGRAILNKQGEHKPSIRPHSEKILLKRRLDISNGVMRPLSDRRNDLIEWGGMKNPEKIFLADNDEETSSKTDNSAPNSNPSPNTHHTAANGDVKMESKVDSPYHSDNSRNPSKTNSPSRMKDGNGPIEFPSEDQNAEDAEDAVVSGGKQSEVDRSVANGAKSKPESESPPLSDPVRLTLRKERNLTREHTYMVDMESSGHV